MKSQKSRGSSRTTIKQQSLKQIQLRHDLSQDSDLNSNTAIKSINQSFHNPSQNDLCSVIKYLKEKMPQRSLEQIIIKMRQKVDANVSKSTKINQKVVQKDKLQRQQPQFKPFTTSTQVKKRNRKKGSRASKYKSFREQMMRRQKENKMKEKQLIAKQLKQFKNEHKNDSNSEEDEMDILDNLEVANYIYLPAGEQKIMIFNLKDTHRTHFINIEEETRYKERRLMAKAFIERGYGVSECRKQIEQEGVNMEMHRNKYKNVAGGVIILAYRKLESFIANQCGKTIKFLDRWQMRSICTIMLNCRTKMEPQHNVTLFKYLKAAFGLEDVIIREIQSVKLFLGIQKFVHGKHVTMEALQRIGKIHERKRIQMTNDYLNRKRIQKQMRQQMLRRRRQELLLQMQNKAQSIFEEDLELSEDQINSLIGIDMIQDLETNNDQTSETNRSIIADEQFWNGETQRDMVSMLVQMKQVGKMVRNMKNKYPQIQSWRIYPFEKKLNKILLRSILRLESQATNQKGNLIFCLNEQQKQILLQSQEGREVRLQLCSYYLSGYNNIQQQQKILIMVNEVLRFHIKMKDLQDNSSIVEKTQLSKEEEMQIVKLQEMDNLSDIDITSNDLDDFQ